MTYIWTICTLLLLMRYSILYPLCGNIIIYNLQDGSMNLWSLSACLINNMHVTKSMLHRGKLVVKPALDDEAVRGNPFVARARQGKFMKEWSCLVTMHERKVIVYDFWATRGIREEPIRNCDSDSSIPSLESADSDEEEEEWGEADHLVHIPNLFIL